MHPPPPCIGAERAESLLSSAGAVGETELATKLVHASAAHEVELANVRADAQQQVATAQLEAQRAVAEAGTKVIAAGPEATEASSV